MPPVVRRVLSSFSLSRRESVPPPRPTIVCTNHEGHILGGVEGHISLPLGVDAFSDPRKTTNANSTSSRQTIAGKMNRPPSLVRQQCGVMNEQQDERRRRSQEARPPVLQLAMPYTSSPVHTLRRVVSDSSIALSVASTCSDYSDSPSTPVARPPPDVPIDYSYSDYEPSLIITSHKDYKLKAPILSPTGERAIIKPSSETETMNEKQWALCLSDLGLTPSRVPSMVRLVTQPPTGPGLAPSPKMDLLPAVQDTNVHRRGAVHRTASKEQLVTAPPNGPVRALQIRRPSLDLVSSHPVGNATRNVPQTPAVPRSATPRESTRTVSPNKPVARPPTPGPDASIANRRRPSLSQRDIPQNSLRSAQPEASSGLRRLDGTAAYRDFGVAPPPIIYPPSHPTSAPPRILSTPCVVVPPTRPEQISRTPSWDPDWNHEGGKSATRAGASYGSTSGPLKTPAKATCEDPKTATRQASDVRATTRRPTHDNVSTAGQRAQKAPVASAQPATQLSTAPNTRSLLDNWPRPQQSPSNVAWIITPSSKKASEAEYLASKKAAVESMLRPRPQVTPTRSPQAPVQSAVSAPRGTRDSRSNSTCQMQPSSCLDPTHQRPPSRQVASRRPEAKASPSPPAASRHPPPSKTSQQPSTKRGTPLSALPAMVNPFASGQRSSNASHTSIATSTVSAQFIMQHVAPPVSAKPARARESPKPREQPRSDTTTTRVTTTWYTSSPQTKPHTRENSGPSSKSSTTTIEYRVQTPEHSRRTSNDDSSRKQRHTPAQATRSPEPKPVLSRSSHVQKVPRQASTLGLSSRREMPQPQFNTVPVTGRFRESRRPDSRDVVKPKHLTADTEFNDAASVSSMRSWVNIAEGSEYGASVRKRTIPVPTFPGPINADYDKSLPPSPMNVTFGGLSRDGSVSSSRTAYTTRGLDNRNWEPALEIVRQGAVQDQLCGSVNHGPHLRPVKSLRTPQVSQSRYENAPVVPNMSAKYDVAWTRRQVQ